MDAAHRRTHSHAALDEVDALVEIAAAEQHMIEGSRHRLSRPRWNGQGPCRQ